MSIISIKKIFTIFSVLIFSVQFGTAANVNISGFDTDGINPAGDALFLDSAPVLTTINVTPLMIRVASGNTRTFTAKGFDQNNNEITISRQVNWVVSNTAVGTIIPINTTSGAFTAIAAGTTIITASSDNVSKIAMAVVTAGLSLGVAEYDVNNDGSIQKSEAVAAVVDYFAGGITKSVAIEVVLAYFTG